VASRPLPLVPSASAQVLHPFQQPWEIRHPGQALGRETLSQIVERRTSGVVVATWIHLETFANLVSDLFAHGAWRSARARVHESPTAVTLFPCGAGDGNRTRTVSLGMETMPASAHEEHGQEHPYLTVAVRQGSFTDRSPTRGSAVNGGVSARVVAQHL
jgi:hypothetical protein